MSNKSKTSHIRIGLSSTLLGAIFVALKLFGVIDWSWIWVTAPFWAGMAFTFAIMLFMGVIALVFLLIAVIAK